MSSDLKAAYWRLCKAVGAFMVFLVLVYLLALPILLLLVFFQYPHIASVIIFIVPFTLIIYLWGPPK